MIRISFRQGLLAGFVVIVLLLGGAALRSWLVVEHFVDQSRRNGEQALAVTASIQELGERTVDMERSARQFLVLQDDAVRQRFDEHLGQALAVVDRLDTFAAKPLKSLLADWREQAEALRSGLDHGAPQVDLAPVMGRLVDLNGLLKAAGKHWIDTQNSELLIQLEANRLRLGGQIAVALVGALLVVMAVGWWLVRPLRNLERAIARLGEKRFDEPVPVGGPADFRQLGRQLDWLRQRLAELEADRERTLRHVSHELKTPLTALREGVALLREEVPGQLGIAQREVVDILQHNVIGLQRQIEGLLSLNAAAFEGSRLARRPVVLHDFLAEAARRRELHSQARHLAVRIEAADKTVSVDDEKLAVIIDNLLSNAIDFSPEGGEIRLLASTGNGILRVECIDQGPGVADEDVERIFEPFVQGRRKASAPRQGSGVGLSIVRELVRALGGSVSLLPAAVGAHFCVEIPHEQQH
ncbi:ATP-binding protein [Dechloromonas sp. H13]|uniref:HAMP domain-containing sensor histidine kinase n=1 Tax=Dechloromonas sp. H13 TaxID=2570193 RepID=UPI001290AB7D|nr:ATP-binding protein [Dechloromonas sp. H13]